MPNYYNPDSFNPGTDFKPNGMLGGYTWAQDRKRYEDLMEIFKSNQQMQQQEQASKLEALLQTQPYQTQETIAKSKANAQWYPDEMRGRAQQQSAKGATDQALMPSAISSGISTNEATVRTNTLTKHQQEQALLEDAIQRLAVTPPGIQQQMLLDSPQYKELPGMDLLRKDPTQAAQILPVIKQIKDNNWNQSEKGRQASAQAALEASKETAHGIRTDKEIAGRTNVANIQAQWHRDQQKMQKEKNESIKKIEQDIVRLANLDSQGKLDADGKKLLQFYMEKAAFEKQSLFAAQAAYGQSFMGGNSQSPTMPQRPTLPSEQGKERTYNPATGKIE